MNVKTSHETGGPGTGERGTGGHGDTGTRGRGDAETRGRGDGRHGDAGTRTENRDTGDCGTGRRWKRGREDARKLPCGALPGRVPMSPCRRVPASPVSPFPYPFALEPLLTSYAALL